MKQNYFKSILEEVPEYIRFLKIDEIEKIEERIKSYSSVEETTIGRTAENKPLKMYTLGNGKKTALIIGVPHSDEPLGSLVTTYLIDWMAKHQEADFFGWKWLIIPVLEQRGMKMNEGWFDKWDSLIQTAKSYFREPTDNQYEWTFPFEYKNYKWVQSRPESEAVKEILRHEKPDLLCNLHHCGFYDTYFYFSTKLPEAYAPLKKLASDLELPLSTSSPDVPFGKILEPGFYQMYGLKDYIDYYIEFEPESLLSMRRGASSDEWYLDTIGGFSFNCEVPLFKSLVKKDNKKTKCKLKNLIQEGRNKRKEAVQLCIDVLNNLESLFSLCDPVLLGSVLKHVAGAKLELEVASLKSKNDGGAMATNFDVFENDVMIDVANLLLIGQVWRVIYIIKNNYGSQIQNRIDKQVERLDNEIVTIADKVNRHGKFVPIPLQKLVKMQLGSILVIADVLSNSSKDE